jgi:hypothetical protein
MEAIANSPRTLVHKRIADAQTGRRIPSLLATVIAYFTIFYLYSSLAWIVMLLYPGIKVAYFLYVLLGTVPFLLAVNRSTTNILHDHWPFVFLIALYFAYISAQYALLGMADISIVRDAYFVKGQFVATVLVSLIAFELSFDIRKLLGALYLVVIFSCVLNVIEFFDPAALPIQLSTVTGRAAGFYQNPNISAACIASAIPLLCGRMEKLGRILCYSITGVGTFVTLSRGGWALWIVAVVIIELGHAGRKSLRSSPTTIGIIAAVTIAAIVLIAAFGPALSLLVSGLGSSLHADTAARLELLANDTTTSRLELARQGMIAFTQAPIFGNGVGYTWQWEFVLSVHNMFVLMLAEQGILGALWLLSLLVVWWRYPQPYGWWLVVLFCVAGFTTHNYFDGPLFGIITTMYLVTSRKLSRVTF